MPNFNRNRTLYAYKPQAAEAVLDAPPKMPGRWTIRKILKRLALLLVTACLVWAGWIGWKFYRAEARLTGNNNPLSLFGALRPAKLKQTNGRVNILLAGYSVDDPGHAGSNLTDSIMIISVNTTTKQGLVLSVPRDLWVKIPGEGHAKINAANNEKDFSAAGYPAGGIGQLEQIIETNLGIDINYYALVNYSAFKQGVDAVGGVSVNIQSSDPRGLYDPNANKLKLPNGWVTLNGQKALDLARARGDNYYAYGFPKGDFDRTAHQRQLLFALKDKATTGGVIANPLKLTQIADAIGNNVKTDMQVNELQSLYTLTKDINNSSLKSYGLDNINNKQLLTGYTSYNGQAALIPVGGIDNFTTIQSVLQTLFASQAQTQTNGAGNGSSSTGQ